MFVERLLLRIFRELEKLSVKTYKLIIKMEDK